MTDLRPQVQVGEDQRVVPRQIHTEGLAAECYGLMNTASILVHSNYESNWRILIGVIPTAAVLQAERGISRASTSRKGMTARIDREGYDLKSCRSEPVR